MRKTRLKLINEIHFVNGAWRMLKEIFVQQKTAHNGTIGDNLIHHCLLPFVPGREQGSVGRG